MAKKLKKLTKKAQREYLLQYGQHCPYCKSKNISGESFEAESSQAWSRITCDDCGRQWRDVYTLTFIEEIK